MIEQWKAVPNFPKYEVSNLGQVRNDRGQIMATYSPNGYLYIKLSKDNVKTTFTIHSLVMWVFVGPAPDGLDVNHKGGDKTHNSLDNLEYVTRGQNLKHAYTTLQRSTMAGRNYHRVTPQNVLRIRECRANGMKLTEIAKEFRVSIGTASLICARKIYTEL
jgi:NUMOD4 motif/HNH endonuclease